MNVHKPTTRMSVEEFETWSQSRDRRHELVGGRPCMLPNVSRNRSLIAGNLHMEAALQIRDKGFAVHQGDLAIQTGPDTIRYADVLIEAAGEPGTESRCERPLALFEILSASTMHVDFGDKRVEYLGLPSLQAFVILAQEEARAWVWQRNDKGVFDEDPRILEGAPILLTLPALGLELVLGDLYRGVRSDRSPG